MSSLSYNKKKKYQKSSTADESTIATWETPKTTQPTSSTTESYKTPAFGHNTTTTENADSNDENDSWGYASDPKVTTTHNTVGSTTSPKTPNTASTSSTSDNTKNSNRFKNRYQDNYKNPFDDDNDDDVSDETEEDEEEKSTTKKKKDKKNKKNKKDGSKKIKKPSRCSKLFSSWQIRKAQRFRSWTVLMLLSLALVLSITDKYPPEDRNGNVLVGTIVSACSAGVSFLVACFHYMDCSRRKFTGNIFELLCALTLFGSWIAGSCIMLNPNNNVATTIDEVNGMETITSANIYGLTWVACLANLYLVVSFYNDFTTMNFKVLCWLFVLSVSVSLMVTANHLTSIICDIGTDIENDVPTRCNRTKYAFTISAVLTVISTIALILFWREEITNTKSLFLESCSLVFYGHAVIMLTSVNGPALNYSTMYFATWAGAAVSVLLIIDSGNNKIKSDVAIQDSIQAFVEEGDLLDMASRTSSIKKPPVEVFMNEPTMDGKQQREKEVEDRVSSARREQTMEEGRRYRNVVDRDESSSKIDF